ncbi:MAG: right-handed parallel beta-helix repeat-containing protein, partial [Flavobacteriales bacterium]
EKEKWLKVRGKRSKGKWIEEGWIEKENVSFDKKHVTFAGLYQKARGIDDEEKRRSRYKELIDKYGNGGQLEKVFKEIAFNNGKSVSVNSMKEFIDQIGPDKTIEIASSPLRIDNLKGYRNRDYYKLTEQYDGGPIQLIIKDVNGLTVKAKNEQVDILHSSIMADVITFEHCEELKIDDLRIGHDRKKGPCEYAVTVFEDCNEVMIDNCEFFGSGAEGIKTEECKNMDIYNTEITDCSYRPVNILTSKNIKFKDCRINNNPSVFSSFTISKSDKIAIKNCMIRNNEMKRGPLVFSEKSNDISIIDSRIVGNTVKGPITNDRESVSIESSDIKGNHFNQES